MNSTRISEEEKIYSYWLCNVKGVGDKTIRKLIELFGSAKRVYHTSEGQLALVLKPGQLEQMKESKKHWNPDKEYDALLQKKIGFWSQGERGYPERLRNIPDPPYGLYSLGRLPEDHTLSVAVIGARECSAYGRYVAEGLGRVLGERGIQVISGMARGIDGISQRAALDAGGVSFGVLGCGVDICYPESNRKLYEQLRQRGGLLSCYPPGTLPKSQNFPPRNRIVSGLADVIVVVEARAKSGTLITVDMALEQGREVYVVPGRITDRLSDGCNRLLRQGAGVLLSPYDFLEDIADKCDKLSQGSIGREDFQERVKLPPQMQQVYEALDYSPQSLEEILERLSGEQKEQPLRVNSVLLELCMRQLALQLTPGHFCLKSR